MNRRSFFRSLALVGAAASLSPDIFIPKFEPVKWKVIAPPHGLFFAEFKYYIRPMEPIYDEIIFHKREPESNQINPDWISAPFIVGAYGDESFRNQFESSHDWVVTYSDPI